MPAKWHRYFGHINRFYLLTYLRNSSQFSQSHLSKWHTPCKHLCHRLVLLFNHSGKQSKRVLIVSTISSSWYYHIFSRNSPKFPDILRSLSILRLFSHFLMFIKIMPVTWFDQDRISYKPNQSFISQDIAN